jgi:hypothetical protein
MRASCEHLRDREAVLTLVFWQAGDFEFEAAAETEGDEKRASRSKR